jgi:signal transduction histidine kinase
MAVQTKTFKNIERVIELSIGILLISGLVIINLPIVPSPNKMVIYVTALLVTLFAFSWHRIKLPISALNKSFLESLVYLTSIAVIVHTTGGSRSYFNFLYLLPNLNVSTSSTKWRTFASWLVASIFIFGEALLFEQPEIRLVSSLSIPPQSLAILNSWAVGLVTVYGRYLQKETETAQTAATAATVEKEKSVNKLKDEFLFIIAHELRGPITAIRGYLELFLNSEATKIGGEVKSLASSASRQSERLNDLIFGLLDLSRLEVGKLKLQNEDFDINEYLYQLVQKDLQLAKEKKINLGFRPGKQKILVLADKERVREVAQNLIDNAIKYTGEFGKIWVWVEERDKEAFISIADTGVGIPSEELPYLFDRFYQPGNVKNLDSAREKKEKSIGLGLFLAKNLVEKMNGQIFVESKLGKGSKFTFTLPLGKNN